MPLKKGRIVCPICKVIRSGMMSMAVHLNMEHKLKEIDIDMTIRGLRHKYG